MGKRVLVIDFDPQGSASLHFGVRDTGEGFLQALEKTIALPVQATAVPGIDLVASGPALSLAAERFSGVLGAELFSRCLTRTQGEWEVFLIDCPPSSGILTMSALRVSRHVVIPVEANQLALYGLDQMMAALESMRRENHAPNVLGIVACRANPRRRVHREIMADLEKRFPGKMAPFVRENVALAEAPAHGQPVTLYAPSSKGAEDYHQVAQWLLQRWS
jgi:chromosome partitioning protein